MYNCNWKIDFQITLTRRTTMKKLTLLLACIMVFASIASVCVSASDVSYTAAYAATKPVIDGKADDAAWAQATATSIAGTKNTNTGNATAPTLKMMHDETYVYALVTYTDTNGTIEGNGYVDAVNGKNNEPVGNEFVWFAFADADGKQASFVFNAPAGTDGSVSMNLYHSEFRTWHCNVGNNGGKCGFTQVENDEEGARAVALRSNNTIVWELRLLKSMVGNVGSSLGMEIYFSDSAVVNGENIWTIEGFDWAQKVVGNHSHIDDISNYGKLTLAAKPAGATEDTSADNTEDTTAKQEESTTAKQEESTTAKQESTTANEPTTGGSTTAPSTADMGLAAAAVVMAAAAMIVLKKKH
jgi:hypothetical protein